MSTAEDYYKAFTKMQDAFCEVGLLPPMAIVLRKEDRELIVEAFNNQNGLGCARFFSQPKLLGTMLLVSGEFEITR